MKNRVSDQLCKDMRALGIREGDTVLVHSALRSLGPLPDAAAVVTKCLLEVLGSDGTLLMPALSYRSVNAASPVFDVNNTPSCVGGLSEYFRQQSNTLRSIHPTHSVCAAGRKAFDLLRGHELDTTSCGKNSPFCKLRKDGDWILFIGCGIAPNTSMHAVEELVEPPYLHGDFIDYRIEGAENICSAMSVRRHNFANYAQEYARMGGLLAPEELRCGNLLSSFCVLMDIKAMWEKGLEALKRDPFYFVRKTL